MILLDIIQVTLLTAIGLLLAYQTILGFLALIPQRLPTFVPDKERRFAIVLPAHNEEKMIAKTIYSISGVLYPKKQYDLTVIADNCTDHTAKIARNLGATVLERTNDSLRGKGYALRWAFDQILASHKNYDAVVVIDSDSLISGNFLDVMNRYLENGSRVIQSADLVLPQPGNWSSEAIRIGFLMFNYVRPLGRAILGLNMGLRGNGMCFSTSLLREIPWQAWSLTEDVEYGLILMLQDVRIEFAPQATVWAQMPLNSANAVSQRTRWESGRIDVKQTYAKRFLKEALRRPSFLFFDVWVDLITPPFVTLMLWTLIGVVVSALLWAFGWMPILYGFLWAGLFLMGIIHLITSMIAGHADKAMYRSLLYIPLYAMWKMGVKVRALTKSKELNWIRTAR